MYKNIKIVQILFLLFNVIELRFVVYFEKLSKCVPIMTFNFDYVFRFFLW